MWRVCGEYVLVPQAEGSSKGLVRSGEDHQTVCGDQLTGNPQVATPTCSTVCAGG